MRRYQPEIIFVSAGFDAHFADPSPQMLVSTRGYFEIATVYANWRMSCAAAGSSTRSRVATT